MRSQPEGFAEFELVAALGSGWGIEATSISYLPVGAGSHHWRVQDRRDRSWFVTVDELDARRESPREARRDVFDRLTAALATAHALEARGADYVVGPVASGWKLVDWDTALLAALELDGCSNEATEPLAPPTRGQPGST